MGANMMKLAAVVAIFVLLSLANSSELHESIARGDLPGVKAALAKGAELNQKCDPNKPCKNQTPVMHAVLNGHHDIVEHLLTLKPNMQITDGKTQQEGYQPIHGAAFKGHAKIAQLLVDHGMNPAE